MHHKYLAYLLSTLFFNQLAQAANYIPVPIHNVKVTPRNGGINPNFAGLLVEGQVQTGTNPCRAAGVLAKLEKIASDERIELLAMIDDCTAVGRVCTNEYNPQFATVQELLVYDRRRLVDGVTIRNVERMGSDRLASEFMPSPSE